MMAWPGRRLGVCLACLALALPMAQAQTAQPSVREDPAALMARASQWQADGRQEAAIWLAKLALDASADNAQQVADWSATLASWLAASGRLDEARNEAERGRAAQLAAFVEPDAPATLRALPATTLDSNEAALSAALAAQLANAPAQPDWNALLQLPRQRAMRPAPPAKARAGSLQVHAIAGPDAVTLLLDDGHSVQSQQVDWPQALRERELGAVLWSLAEPPAAGGGDAAQAGLQALYRRFGAVVEAAAARAHASEIEVHAQGTLRSLPWAALLGTQAYLGERYALRVAATPGGAARAAWPGRSGAGMGVEAAALRLQALGASRPAAGLQPLPGVVREVCGIVAGPVHGLQGSAPACGPGVVAGEGWLDEAFTAERLMAAVARQADGTPRLLHLGTHFDLRPGRMAKSSLLLGDGSRWPLARIAALDFSGQALVTLAACETGDSGSGAAESLQDLVLRLGAGHVLASLWRVDDASTSALMRSFYRHLAQASPAVALQRAQADVRGHAAWRHPFHWAGFMLAGGP